MSPVCSSDVRLQMLQESGVSQHGQPKGLEVWREAESTLCAYTTSRPWQST